MTWDFSRNYSKSKLLCVELTKSMNIYLEIPLLLSVWLLFVLAQLNYRAMLIKMFLLLSMLHHQLSTGEYRLMKLEQNSVLLKELKMRLLN